MVKSSKILTFSILVMAVMIFSVACGEQSSQSNQPTTQTNVASDAAPISAPSTSNDPLAKGEKLFTEKTCSTCHMINGKGGVPGNQLNGVEIPDLGQVGSRLTKEQIVKQIVDPKGVKPDGQMAPLGVSEEDAGIIADYLMTLK